MTFIRTVKHAMPPLLRSVGAKLRSEVRRLFLDIAIRRIAALPRDASPGARLLAAFTYGWGNSGWSASIEDMKVIAEAVINAKGPILECGSGASTILIGLLAEKRGVEVWALEHDKVWHEQNRRVLDKHNIRSVKLCHAPLVSYGDFCWYSPPLAMMPHNFSFVVCDGPPDTTPGGRYGLLPVMVEHLDRQCKIFLDDTSRPGERMILERWNTKYGASGMLGGPNGDYAIVTVGNPIS